MDFESLKTLLTLVKCGNFTKTAEELNLVQSTVTNRIQSLEKSLGMKLVIRSKNGIEPTAEGRVFLHYAKQLTLLKDIALRETRTANQFDDHLNLICVNWIYDRWLAPLVEKFSRQNPHMALHITIAHGEEIVPLMRKGAYDIAYMSYEMTTFSLISKPFAYSKIILVASPSCPTFQRKISKLDLFTLPLIYSEMWENSISEISDEVVSAKKVCKVNCNMLHIAKQFCLAGHGYCFLPEEMVIQELKEKKLVHISIRNAAPADMQIYAVYQKKREPSAAMQAWFSCVKT